MYCSIDQLITQFTEAELIQRTDQEPFTGVINADRLNQEIVSASKFIDGYIGSVYSLPLSANRIASSALPEMCGHIVRFGLYKDVANEEVEKRHKIALAWLREVQAKRVSLGEDDETIAATGAVAVFSGRSRVDWESF